MKNKLLGVTYEIRGSNAGAVSLPLAGCHAQKKNPYKIYVYFYLTLLFIFCLDYV